MEQLLKIDGMNARSVLSIIETASNKDIRPILTGVCFHRTANNELELVSTDSAILSRTTIQDATMSDDFNEIVISSDSLKVLKDYKKYPVVLTIFKDNDEYVMEVNGNKHFIKVINGDYPNTSGITVKSDDDDYTISLSQNVIEKLLKTIKASGSETVSITFNTKSNMKPFKAVIKKCYDLPIDIIATPVRES